jgi:hypothetical protein
LNECHDEKREESSSEIIDHNAKAPPNDLRDARWRTRGTVNILKVPINHAYWTWFDGIKKTKEYEGKNLHPNIGRHHKNEYQPEGNDFIPDDPAKIFPPKLFANMTTDPATQ